MTIQLRNEITDIQTTTEWKKDQIELIKRTICVGATDDQLMLFENVCKFTGLNPFMKQIYGIVRNGKNGPTMTIQTSIDGLRLIADRSGNYLPGKEATFTYKNDKLLSATSYIKKFVKGEWHEIAATAFYDEYKPSYINDFWSNKPHIMLSKCAEALALRKAFPAEMSGVYTKEELDQMGKEDVVILNDDKKEKNDDKKEKIVDLQVIDTISEDQQIELTLLIEQVDKLERKPIIDFIENQYQGDISKIKLRSFDLIKSRVQNKIQESMQKIMDGENENS